MKDDGSHSYEGLCLDDDDELNALTLSTLLNSGVEEALSSLTPEQLMRLAQNVEKLKKQKTPATGKRGRSEHVSPRKRRAISDERDDSREGSRGRSSGGQFMNLPASAPQIEKRDEVEYLLFTYSTKGHVQEYCICIDIDNLSLDDIPDDFKSENCVYPRALVPREAYIGNRYDYETIVNEIAWKLTWMNASVLAGKRGLIQRAVDSYRNRVCESRSRRVLRQEKLTQGTLRRRAESYDGESHPRTPKTLSFAYSEKGGETVKIKVRIDVENVDTSLLDEAFKAANCIYPQAYEEKDAYPDSRWEYENACNDLGWKLAYLNAPKLSDNRPLLQRAVDAYNQRFDHDHSKHSPLHIDHFEGNNGEFTNMVARTLQQALSNEDAYHHPHSHHMLGDPSIGSPHEDDDDDYDGEHDLNRHSRSSTPRSGIEDGHAGEDEDHPQTVSTADLLLNH
jgi:hypothetical protein